MLSTILHNPSYPDVQVNRPNAGMQDNMEQAALFVKD